MKQPDPLHDLLRSLPLRRAPASLEQRVLSAIRQRSDLAWWQQSLREWPWPARGLFALACAASMGFVWWSASAGPQGILALGGSGALFLAWLRSLAAALTSVDRAWSVITQTVPALWVYAILALGAGAYSVIFIVGAATYRVLNRRPSA